MKIERNKRRKKIREGRGERSECTYSSVPTLEVKFMKWKYQ